MRRPFLPLTDCPSRLPFYFHFNGIGLPTFRRFFVCILTQECLALVLSIRCVLTTVILKFNRMRFSRFWLLDL